MVSGQRLSAGEVSDRTLFEELAELSSDWFWETDVEHRFTYISHGTTQNYLKQDTNKFLGTIRWENIFGKDASLPEKWLKHIEQLNQQEPFSDFRYRFDSPEGEVIYASISGRPRFNKNGEFLGYRGIGSDCTEETRTQRSLSSLFHDNPLPMLLFSTEKMQLASANEIFLRNYIAEADLTSSNVSDFFDRASVDSLTEFSSKASEGEKITLKDYARLRTRSSSEVQAEVTAYIINFDGEKTCCCLIYDLTERERLRELSESKEQLSYDASHDPLTNVLNRRGFEDQVHSQLEALDPSDHYALFYLDVDRFKIINDLMGHGRGDIVLKKIAEALSAQLEAGQVLGRVGGDEFGLIVPYADNLALEDFANKLLDSVREIHIDDSNSYRVSISIGIAEAEVASNNLDKLLSRADNACYVVKKSGGDSFHFYSINDSEVQYFHAITHSAHTLNEAIHNNKLLLARQPIFAVSDLEQKQAHPKYYEILVRAKFGDRIISPSDLLIGAEHFNFSYALDKWVINAVIEWFHNSGQSGEPGYSINLSRRSLANDDFTSFVLDSFTRHQVDPKHFTFEITETTPAGETIDAASVLNQLKAAGARIALDDFGSGHSNLAEITTLPLDLIKIDGRFIQGLENSETKQMIVKSVSDLAQAMQMETVAEKVETKEALDVLARIGINYVQGYFTGRPELIPALNGAVDTPPTE